MKRGDAMDYLPPKTDFKQLSGAERIMISMAMFEITREVVIALLQEDGYEGVELKKQTFLYFYKNDFSPEQLEKILVGIERWYERQQQSY